MVCWSDTVELTQNTAVYGVHKVVFRENTVLFLANTLVFWENIVVFGEHLVIFWENAVAFGLNRVVNSVVFEAWLGLVFGENTVECGKNTATS